VECCRKRSPKAKGLCKWKKKGYKDFYSCYKGKTRRVICWDFPSQFFFILLNTTNLFSNYLLMLSLSPIVRVQKLLIYNITILWGTFQLIDFSFGFFKIFLMLIICLCGNCDVCRIAHYCKWHYVKFQIIFYITRLMCFKFQVLLKRYYSIFIKNFSYIMFF